MNIAAWILVSIAAAGLCCGCAPPRTQHSARVIRAAGAVQERILLQRSSRPVLPRAVSQTVALPDAAGCRLHVGFANLDAGGVAVFLADAAGGSAETRLISATVMPGSGWHEEAVTIPEGARELRLVVDGDAKSSAVWTRPVLSCTTPQAEVPNILVVSLDTLRADRLSAYGGTPALMPHLNEFASRSTVFANAYSQYPQTLGSHATLFTSLYPSEHGVLLKEKGQARSRRIAPDADTLATAFARSGYATVAFTEDAYVGSAFGFDSGFDQYHDGPAVTLGEGFPGNAEETFGRAADWLGRRPAAPFFMFLHTYQVHTPYAPPRAQLEAVLASRPGINADKRQPTYEEVQSFAHNKRVGLLDAPAVEWAGALYDAEAAYLDVSFGGFLARLGKLGLMDDTIIVVLSDHGEEFAEHGLMGHGHDLHEEVLRVPLLVLEPGRTSGAKVPEPVGLIDVGPTILELAGIGAGLRRPSGRSLVAAMRGKAGDGSAPVYSEMNASYVACPATQTGLAGQAGQGGMENCRHELVGVRDGSFSYMINLTTGAEQLYSMKEDRGEQRDLSAQQPELARTYRERIEQFRKSGLPRQADAPAAVDPEAESRLKALGYLQ